MEFDIQHGRIRVKPETLMLGELRAIWEADDSPNKELATEVLTYIHIAAQVDEKTPFFNAREDEIRELAKNNVWFQRECRFNLLEVEPALLSYKKSKEVGEMRVLKIFNRKIDQLQDKIDGIEPDIRERISDKGVFLGYASNMKMITDIMAELNPLLDEKDKLTQRMKKQSEIDKTFRAGKKQNLLEKQLLGNGQNQSNRPNESAAQEAQGNS